MVDKKITIIDSNDLESIDYNNLNLNDSTSILDFIEKSLHAESFTKETYEENQEKLTTYSFSLNKILVFLRKAEKETKNQKEKMAIYDVYHDASFINTKISTLFLIAENSSLNITTQNSINDAKKELNDAKKELNDTESKILTHVLSLLGIFTAIITVIISVISTTTSWLNNADEISFSIAVIIPALVTVIAVGSLLILMDLFLFNKGEKKIKKIWEYTIFIIGLLILGAVTIVCLCLQKDKKSCEDYIPIEEYKVYVEENKLTYTYNEVEFTIKLNYDLIHEDGLHYCTIHNKFE